MKQIFINREQALKAYIQDGIKAGCAADLPDENRPWALRWADYEKRIHKASFSGKSSCIKAETVP